MTLSEAQIIDQRRALHELLDAVNNMSEVARGCGLNHRQGLSLWLISGKITNPIHVPKAVKFAKSRGLDIPPHRFRPDVYIAPKGYRVPPASDPIPGYTETNEQRYIKPSLRNRVPTGDTE